MKYLGSHTSSSEHLARMQDVGGGGTTWSIVTTTHTAASGELLLCDTSGGVFTVTLPATPSANDFVTFKSGPASATNTLTIARNGETIEGAAEDLTVTTNYIEFTLVFDGTTWRV